MESSPKGVLTPLQADALKGFFRYPNGFFLSGGAALAEFYLGHRGSKDLDFFAVEDRAFVEGPALLEATARDLGAVLAPVQSALTFRRYTLNRGEEQVTVDLVRETAHQAVPDKPNLNGIRVDSIEDITANKLCTVLSRLETRDYLDLFFLAKAGVSLDGALPEAERKDGGLSKTMLALLMSRFRLQTVPDYLRLPLSPEEVTRFFQDLAERWARESAPRQSNSP